MCQSNEPPSIIISLVFFVKFGEYISLNFINGYFIDKYDQNLHLKSLEILIQDTKITLKYNDTECVLNNPNNFQQVELLSEYSLDMESFVFIEGIDS